VLGICEIRRVWRPRVEFKPTPLAVD
jgi:hypothetical protein